MFKENHVGGIKHHLLTMFTNQVFVTEHWRDSRMPVQDFLRVKNLVKSSAKVLDASDTQLRSAIRFLPLFPRGGSTPPEPPVIVGARPPYYMYTYVSKTLET